MSLWRSRVWVRTLPVLVGGAVLMAVPGVATAQSDAKSKDAVDTCPMPFGTIAINEPHEQSMYWLRSYQLGSPSSLLRTFAQRSNCFVVVERGVGMQNMKQERELASAGEIQEGQNIGKGQMVSADYMLTPAIQGTDNNAGGVGGGARLPGRLGGIVGGIKKKEAQTSITVASVRTGVQVAAAEGAATKRDFAIGGIGLGVGAGGYTSTSEGKMVAASLLDNFNKVIQSLKTNPNVRAMTADRLARITAGEPEAGGAFEKGSLVEVKMNGTKLLTSASATSGSLATLRAGETMMYMGERQGDFLRVQRGSAQGWVEQVLITQSAAKTSASGGATAGGVMNEGDVVAPKIDGVKILRTASDSAAVVATLKRSDDLVFLGEEDGTFIKVQGSGGEGWVKRSLVAARK